MLLFSEAIIRRLHLHSIGVYIYSIPVICLHNACCKLSVFLKVNMSGSTNVEVALRFVFCECTCALYMYILMYYTVCTAQYMF